METDGLEEWLGCQDVFDSLTSLSGSPLDYDQYLKQKKGFYDWFCEQEGFHIREERFWDDIANQDTRQLLKWLKCAWRLGYEQALYGND